MSFSSCLLVRETTADEMEGSVDSDLRSAISEAVGWRGSENFFKALVSYVLRYSAF